MLTHHSGLPGDLQNGGFTLKPRSDYNAWVLDYLKGEYACYPPGFIWAYSNTAYSLLGEVVSRASGQSFEEYTDRLFEEMGMHHSSYFHDKPAVKENLGGGKRPVKCRRHGQVRQDGPWPGRERRRAYPEAGNAG